MALIMVSYDLHGKKSEDYQNLTDAVEQYGTKNVRRVLYSTWLIHTDDSTEKVHAHLRSCFATNDSFIVNPLDSFRRGWLKDDAWDWINERI